MIHEGSVRHAPTIPRPHKKRTVRGRANKLVLILLLLVIVLGLLSVVGISTYVGWSLTHPEKKPIDETPEQFGLAYQEIEILSQPDQLKLAGWKLEAAEPSRGVIIMAHGYKGNRLEKGLPALALASDLVQNHYHVIMFDFRNSGESEGNLTSVGYHEKKDLLSVVQYATEKYPNQPIGLIGFSMGASTALVAAAEDDSIKAVVADSPFADLREYLTSNLSYWSNLPEFPFTPTIMTIIPMLTGLDPDEVKPKEAIKNYSTPVLLIHGDGDTAIPNSNSKEILENSHKGQATLWVPSQSGHVKGYADYPEEYTVRVLQFFDQNVR